MECLSLKIYLRESTKAPYLWLEFCHQGAAQKVKSKITIGIKAQVAMYNKLVLRFHLICYEFDSPREGRRRLQRDGFSATRLRTGVESQPHGTNDQGWPNLEVSQALGARRLPRRNTRRHQRTPYVVCCDPYLYNIQGPDLAEAKYRSYQKSRTDQASLKYRACQRQH